MRRFAARQLCCLLAVCLLGASSGALAAERGTAAAHLDRTAAFLTEAVPAPTPGSMGGEWLILGLVRAGHGLPEGGGQAYWTALEAHVTACDGVLHERKYTEYARTVLAVTALGKDPRDVAGYDLLAPLGDFDKTIYQGLSGPAWALIALDSGGYALPEGVTASRARYVDELLARQNGDGGFALSKGGASEADMTAMVLQALAPYREREEVSAAVAGGLDFLSSAQREGGAYDNGGVVTAESTAQVIIALCTLGVDLEAPQFTKHGATALDGLLSLGTPEGGFRHVADGATDQMATEQALLALAAVERGRDGAAPLYQMRGDGDRVSEFRPLADLPVRWVLYVPLLLCLEAVR